MMNATFTADAHMDGEPKDVPLNPLTNIIMGGEAEHGKHHRKVGLRHSKYDPGYVVIKALERVRLARIPVERALQERAPVSSVGD